MPPNEKTDDVIVKIEGEGDEQLSLLIDDPNDKPADKAPKAKAKADDGADDLKKQLSSAKERERELSIARENEAAARIRAENEAAEAKKQVASTQADAIATALASAKGEADALQGQIQQALESGEYKAASELQRKLARAEATIMRYEDAKTELEVQAKAPKPEPKAEQQPQRRMAPRAEAWLREHPEYNSDPKLRNKLVAAHYTAVAEEHALESDAYFARVEEILGMREPAESETEYEEEAPRRQPRHSAPVSREAPANKHGVSGNRVTLTRAEVEMAKDLNMTPAEYANYKRKAVVAGSYDPR